jgi:DNA invertase Pin-like site-specific DNA recombinase
MSQPEIRMLIGYARVSSGDQHLTYNMTRSRMRAANGALRTRPAGKS